MTSGAFFNKSGGFVNIGQNGNTANVATFNAGTGATLFVGSTSSFTMGDDFGHAANEPNAGVLNVNGTVVALLPSSNPTSDAQGYVRMGLTTTAQNSTGSTVGQTGTINLLPGGIFTTSRYAGIADGIYGVVDWHSMEGAQKDLQSAEEFFTAVATQYGNTSNIMYEPWNDSVQEPWTVIKAYHEAVISKIRAIDPDSIIICGSRNWDQQCAEASRDPITTSKNIAYSIHFYAATHKQKLRDNGTEALKNGVALFCTEYGSSSATGGDAYNPAETQTWWNWLADNDISCCNWSAAALAEVSAAFKPGTNATGPWTDVLLKPSGLLVRNYIISKYSLVTKNIR